MSSKSFLGIELAGAKNQKTALAAIEFYPKEKKVFLLDIYEKIGGDEALLEIIQEHTPGVAKVGINVALGLPPCIQCERKACMTATNCTAPAVKWMRQIAKRASKDHQPGDPRVLGFTPYTQRPVELWMRYEVLPQLPVSHRFEIDETLGGNRAPLTARMHYLKRFLGRTEIIEAWPKLSIAILALELGLQKRVIARYRQLEEGVFAREEILDVLSEQHGIFIYERDIHKLAQNLSSFDAFICAYTALLADLNLCAKPPAGFPIGSGWVHYPKWETRGA